MSNESIEDKNQPGQADVISLCEYRKRREYEVSDFDTNLERLEKSCKALNKAIKGMSRRSEHRCPKCGKSTGVPRKIETIGEIIERLYGILNYVSAARTVRTMRERAEIGVDNTAGAILGFCHSCKFDLRNDRPLAHQLNKGRG